jgi:hypothetical protein
MVLELVLELVLVLVLVLVPVLVLVLVLAYMEMEKGLIHCYHHRKPLKLLL